MRVIGITILDADCRAELAWNTTLKLLHTLGHEHVPVAVSSLPAVNPFPDPWRNSVLSVDVLPHINDLTQVSRRGCPREGGDGITGPSTKHGMLGRP